MSHPFDSNASQHDPYFVLRDVRSLIEKRLSEATLRLGSVSVAAAGALAKAAGETHDALANDRQRDGFDIVASLTASRMTLMCDADLEVDIHIGNLVRRVLERCANPLWRTHQRYLTLLRRPEMKPEANPVGAETLIAGLWALCEACEVALDRKLDMLDKLEEVYSSELPVIYEEVNELMASRGIDLAQPQLMQTSSARRDAAAAGGAEGGSAADPFAALQRMLGGQFAAVPGTQTTATPGSGGNVALNAATLVMLNQLTEKLERLQIAAAPDASAAGDMQPKALKAADLDLPLGNPEGVALETLGHIFEAIFNIWDLPDTVKTAIGRLQIPLLRLSVCDPTLFSDSGHPARRLINGMGRAVLGLPRDIPRSHPVSAYLWRIASVVAETLHGNPSVLDEPLAEVEALIREREATEKAAAAPIVAHLRAQEVIRNSIDRARQWLTDTSEKPSAAAFHAFFRDYWVRVMAVAARDSEGDAWQAAAQTAEDLTWSVLPKADAEERKRLAGMVPGLLKRLNGGLDRICVSPEERAPFLDACFNLQTASLRGAPPPLVMGDASAEAVLPRSAAPRAGETIGGMVLHYLSRPTGETSAYRTASTASLAEQWLQISQDDGTQLTGFVAWIGDDQNAALIVNTALGSALLADMAALDERLRAGKLLQISRRAIFDVAAERALQQIAASG